MPNICSNTVTVEGPLPALRRFVAEQINVYTPPTEKSPVFFSFNTIIPMPVSLNITSGSESSNAYDVYYNAGKNMLNWPWVAKLGITNFTELMHWADKEHPTWKSLADQIAYNKAVHGHATWYEWAIANWDTKWDAGRPDGGVITVNPSDESLGSFVFGFSTAWSPPASVLDALARRYSGLSFTNEWEEEGGEHDCNSYYYEEPLEQTDSAVLQLTVTN